MVIFCYYPILSEAKLLMEVMGLGSHAVKEGEVTDRWTRLAFQSSF